MECQILITLTSKSMKLEVAASMVMEPIPMLLAGNVNGLGSDIQ